MTACGSVGSNGGMQQGTSYHVITAEPPPLDNEHANADKLPWDVPSCPLCGSAYVGAQAYGPSPTGTDSRACRVWLECFLNHCVEIEWSAAGDVTRAAIVDRPRITIGVIINSDIVTVLGDETAGGRIRRRKRK